MMAEANEAFLQPNCPGFHLCLYISALLQESKPKPPSKRSQPEFLRNITVSVKPRAKKAKSDVECKPAPKELVPSNGHDTNREPQGDAKSSVLGSLAAYGDDDDDESGDER